MDLVSPHPFWPIKNGLLNVFPSLKTDIRADVAILGAGISGAMMAERLSREGLNVVVLDKREAASGSTSASTALLQYEIDTPLTELTRMIGQADAERAYQLCHASIDAIETLVARVGTDRVFQRKRSVWLASKQSHARMLAEEVKAREALGIAVDYLDADDVSARFSFSRPAALVSQQAAELDCHRFTYQLLAAAQANGARIFDRTSVKPPEATENGVELTTDRGCKVRVKHVVFATGYESQELLPHRVVTLKSSYALASEPLEAFSGWWEQALIWETTQPYVYLRTTPDGRALIGGEDDPFRNPKARDARVKKKTEKLAKKFREFFPDIELEVAYRWAGTFGETKDGLAYIGAVKPFPRCHFALGFGGNGITYSAIAADLIRDALFERPNADARLFRFDR